MPSHQNENRVKRVGQVRPRQGTLESRASSRKLVTKWIDHRGFSELARRFDLPVWQEGACGGLRARFVEFGAIAVEALHEYFAVEEL